jgi:hypothetical protein
MTFFDDVGESTCNLLPFELGCAYVGNKCVALEGKLKRATRKGIARATKGAIRGVIKGVVKEVIIKGVTRDLKKLQEKS